MSPDHALVAILPCSDMNAAEAFFARLGFLPAGFHDANYRILADPWGAQLHLRRDTPAWLTYAQNPFGLYLYTDRVDEAAHTFRAEMIQKNGPEDKPWGMYEFAVNGPDGVLTRIGRLSRKDAQP